MRRIFAFLGVLALVVAFSMPMAAEAASHNKDKKNPCNPCGAKNPCNPCGADKTKAKAQEMTDKATDKAKEMMKKKDKQ